MKKLNVGFLVMLLVLIVVSPYFIAAALVVTFQSLIFGDDEND